MYFDYFLCGYLGCKRPFVFCHKNPYLGGESLKKFDED
jgi:hypothetical protein